MFLCVIAISHITPRIFDLYAHACKSLKLLLKVATPNEMTVSLPAQTFPQKPSHFHALFLQLYASFEKRPFIPWSDGLRDFLALSGTLLARRGSVWKEKIINHRLNAHSLKSMNIHSNLESHFNANGTCTPKKKASISCFYWKTFFEIIQKRKLR